MNAAKTNSDNGREANGQFAKGNPGGPGNPFNREVAALRKALIAAVSAEDIKNIIKQVVIKASFGDLAAAKIVLSYVIGKPASAVDPDRIDLDEWKITRDRPQTEQVQAVIQSGCMPDLAVSMVRGMDIAMLEQGGRIAESAWTKADQRRETKRAKRRKREASELSILGNGTGQAEDDALMRQIIQQMKNPSGNGHNGDAAKG